jgi:hypothetical protein
MTVEGNSIRGMGFHRLEQIGSSCFSEALGRADVPRLLGWGLGAIRGLISGVYLGLCIMGLRPIISYWTPEEDGRLRELVRQGAAIVRAAAALKRSMSTVRNRANKLGCPFTPICIARKKWAKTPEWQAAQRR